MHADADAAFVAGLQLMALIAGVFINVIGLVSGANYYIESIPFFGFSILAPVLLKVLRK